MAASNVSCKEDEFNLTINLTTKPFKSKKSSANSDHEQGLVEDAFLQEIASGHLKSSRFNVKDDKDSSKKRKGVDSGSQKNKISKKEKDENLKLHTPPKHFISSLFTQNVAIPEVKLSDIKKTARPLFSQQTFNELSLHSHLIACLKDRFQVTQMTEVQKKAIPLLLNNKDALIKSATGSGKTLAYAIPIVQQLQEIRPKIQRSDGIFALVITPTRELAVQSYECFQKLTQAFTWIVPGCLMGEEKKKSEKARIRKGINILVSTPGRLLDHIEHTANLSLKKIRWFIIDEADRLMDLGFEQTVSQVVKILTSQCEGYKQTVLLSATLSKGVQHLAGMSLADPAVVDVAAVSPDSTMTSSEFVVPDKLKQHFVICPTKLRLISLSAFIVDKCALGQLKALIFMSAQDVVDFHHALFQSVLLEALTENGHHITFFRLHGNMKQQDRMQVFQEFKETNAGILLCTDVAARGLDLFDVDWIVQFSPPSQPEDYVHRVGRTARIGKQGQALLFVLPSEAAFIEFLQQHKISLEEMNTKDVLKSLLLLTEDHKKKKQLHHFASIEEYASSLQMRYENAVYEDKELLDIAKKAFTSYVRSYSSYPKSLKEIFNFKNLHLGHVAKTFCLREAPSALGASVAAMIRRQKNSKSSRSSPFKRKKEYLNPPVGKSGFSNIQKQSMSQISEYDSGLNVPLPKLTSSNHQLKRKIPKLLDYDSEHSVVKKKMLTKEISGSQKLGIPKVPEHDRKHILQFKKQKLKGFEVSEYDSGLDALPPSSEPDPKHLSRFRPLKKATWRSNFYEKHS